MAIQFKRKAGLLSLLLFFHLLSANAQFSNTPRQNTWFPNGPVFSAVHTNGMLFVGGMFNQIGPLTGGFAVVDQATGAVISYPSIKGSVDACIPDGFGGVLLGGNFTLPDAPLIRDLARLDSNDQLDPNFNHHTDGEIYDLVVYGQTLFVAGSFSSFDGQSRTNFAAIDLGSGQLTSLTVNSDWPIAALAFHGDTLYVGGNFTSINGTLRNYLAAIDLVSGQLLSWDPLLNSTFGFGVTSLVVSDGKLYTGGDFTQVGGINRNWAVAFDTTSGSLLPWNPQLSASFNGAVGALAVSSNAVYIAGAFEKIGGQDRTAVGSVNKTTGAVTPWQPGIWANGVRAFGFSGSTVYMGGDFLAFSSNGPPCLAAVDATTGAASGWKPAPNSTVTSLLVNQGKVYVGGFFNSIGGLTRQLLGALSVATGTPLDWNAQIAGESVSGDAVNALTIYNDSLFAAGRFWAIGGQSRVKMGAVNYTNALAQPFNANLGINALAHFFFLLPVGPDILCTGVTWTGEPVAFNAQSGLNNTWSFGTEGPIHSFAATATTLFVGGTFTNVNGQSRGNLAAYDISTRQLLPWNPKVNGPVFHVYSHDQTIVAIGNFSNANGQLRTNIAVLDNLTGNLIIGPQSLSVNGPVGHVSGSSNSLFISGAFTLLNGVARTNFGAIDLLTGQTTAWNPEVKTNGSAIKGQTIIADTNLILIGNIHEIGGSERQGLAIFSLTNQPFAQIISPALLTNVHVPVSVDISVQAGPGSHAISRVEVYDNTNRIVTFFHPPYTTNWMVPKHVGSHLLTAAVFDSTGESALSSAVRVNGILPNGYIAPSVQITFPVNGGVYAPFTNISVQLTVTNPSSTIETGELRLGTNVMANISGSFTTVLTNLSPGTYSISANIMDEYGIKATNGPITFRINAPPAVTLVSPTSGLIRDAGTNISFLAFANDPDGFVKNLKFLSSTNVIAERTNSPFSFTFTNIPSGNYAFRAVATDDFGSSVTSAVAYVAILPLPAVNLVLDNTDTNVSYTGNWILGTTASGRYGADYRFALTTNNGLSNAIYRPNLPVGGLYDVYVYYPAGPNRSTNALWTLSHSGGSQTIGVDQTTNGGKWVLLASANFDQGTNGFVSLSNFSEEVPSKVVLADAVRFASATAPTITVQPQSKSVTAGTNVVFNVVSSGTHPLNYQWRFNGTDLAGENASVLSLFQVNPSDAGLCSVVVSNNLGSVTSFDAVLGVNPPRPPSFGLITISTNHQFQVTLTGDAGAPLAIEESLDLLNWTVLTNFSNASGSIEFGYSITNLNPKFFRARWVND